MTKEQIVLKKLQKDWYENMGWRERRSIVLCSQLRAKEHPSNPGIYIINGGAFEITCGHPLYPDGTVVG